MRIVLLSTGQPATNPRLLKEADMLSDAGYSVKAYCSHCADWALPMDRRLMEGRSWTLEYVGGLPYREGWAWSRIRFRLANTLLKMARGISSRLDEQALSRTTPELMAAARRDGADIYIGHNLGALPAAVAGARRNGGRAIFDLEDVYAGILRHDEGPSVRQALFRRIEDRYIPACQNLIAASDGIGAIYETRYHISPVTVLNAFPLKWGIEKPQRKRGDALKLFWFSQTIGPDRGLEDVIHAMGRLQNQAIELHLLGSWQPGYREKLEANARSLGIDTTKQIYSYPPRPPEEIPRFAASFDIGLALELPLTQNRNVCLTNKVFTYLLAGNAIVATETEGQKRFFDNMPDVGFTYPPGDIDTLVSRLGTLIDDRQRMMRLSNQAIDQARQRYNWDIEGRKLLNLIEKEDYSAAVT